MIPLDKCAQHHLIETLVRDGGLGGSVSQSVGLKDMQENGTDLMLGFYPNTTAATAKGTSHRERSITLSSSIQPYTHEKRRTAVQGEERAYFEYHSAGISRLV